MKTTQFNKLKTIKNFALYNKVTTSYIYKLIKEKKMKHVIIDGVHFIDTLINPTIPTK